MYIYMSLLTLMLLNWFLVFDFIKFIINQSCLINMKFSDILLTHKQSFASWEANNLQQSQKSFE